MTKKNATLQALFTSVLSLLLCVSMLVGTTFAWFTDRVDTGMNTIAAGNLDVELLADGNEVDETTPLFDDVTLWEPGVVVYENLQVANVGTLALKYQMSMNFGKENDLNGHKLSEVLQVAIIDKIEDGADRQTVLAAAKASENVGTLSNFYLTGELEAGVESAEQTVVIFWEPSTDEIDNLYNANNGQTTSDGEPLHIEFGITLVATQLMHENDSFGPDYDKFASILPKAKVSGLPAQTISATWGIGGATTELEAPFIMKFEPNESLDEAKVSAYKYWHVDFVAKADRDVPADSMALAGYYSAWCDTLNNKNWVALTASETIPADTEIRLVDSMGSNYKVTYKDICEYGNDGIGFQCTAIDLTGVNAGTTLTVELRMYVNESDPSDSSYNGGTETGDYYVIGTYTYTFPAAPVSTMAELNAALDKGVKVIDAKGANLGDFYYDAVFTDDVVIKNAKFTYFYGGNVEGTVTFENCEFVSDHSYSANFDSGNGNIIFNNCLFDGWSSFGTAITNVEMNNCTFQKSYSYGMLRFYQTAQLNNCTFADGFEGVDTNVTGCKVELTNCTGITGKIFNNGSNVGVWVVDDVDVSDQITSW